MNHAKNESDTKKSMRSIAPASLIDADHGSIESRRERRKREVRERIYDAARELFLKHGFAATTVEQIAERADVAETTFFNHFQSKGDLLQEMTREVAARLEAMLAQQLATPGTAIERIAGFAKSVVKSIGEAQSLVRDVLLELLRSSSHPGKPLPYVASVYDPFTEILRQGQTQGNVRKDRDARLLAEMVIGTLNMALVGWLNDSNYPFEKRLHEFTSLIGEVIQPQQK